MSIMNFLIPPGLGSMCSWEVCTVNLFPWVGRSRAATYSKVSLYISQMGRAESWPPSTPQGCAIVCMCAFFFFFHFFIWLLWVPAAVRRIFIRHVGPLLSVRGVRLWHVDSVVVALPAQLLHGIWHLCSQKESESVSCSVVSDSL